MCRSSSYILDMSPLSVICITKISYFVPYHFTLLMVSSGEQFLILMQSSECIFSFITILFVHFMKSFLISDRGDSLLCLLLEVLLFYLAHLNLWAIWSWSFSPSDIKLTLCHLFIYTGVFVEIQMSAYIRFYFWLAILFHWLICLFLYQDHIIITAAL